MCKIVVINALKCVLQNVVVGKRITNATMKVVRKLLKPIVVLILQVGSSAANAQQCALHATNWNGYG